MMLEDRPVTPSPDSNTSPRWSGTTKLVVALTTVAILAGLLIRFRPIVGLLLAAIILAYLLYPVSDFFHKKIRISWRFSAFLVFLVLLVGVLSLLTLGGLAVFEQVQNLVRFVDVQIRNLPHIAEQLTAHPIQIGIFEIDLTQFDLRSLASQLLGMVQPVLSNLTTLIGRVAAGAATTVGWLFFAILIAYFILNDSGGVRERLINLQIPGYSEDISRMGRELSRIWNAFLRGQMIIFFITVIIYVSLLGSLGVSFYFGLALVAGLARFVPYIGAWITWITYGLVSFFQGTTLFGMEPLLYVVVVLAVALVVDFILDNFLVPRLMGDALNIHPAAVMIAALVSANLFGLVGVLLAAPVVSTLKLLANYVFRKMFDLDPWEGMAKIADREPTALAKWVSRKFGAMVGWVNRRIQQRFPNGIPLVNWIESFFALLKRAPKKRTALPGSTQSHDQSLQDHNPEN
ncbi:MAG: AI-2E family transporter [Bellilinea sp.]|jgi:predicted PurR-regulated permease PerM